MAQAVYAGPKHGPRQAWVDNAPGQFGIDEVAQAASRITERHEWRNEVQHVGDAAVAFAGSHPHGDQHANEPAVKRHAAFPGLENFNRVGQEITRLVKEHLAQTAADDDT